MDAERWAIIDRLLDQAMERPPESREDFLAAACARQLDLHDLAAPLFGLVSAVDGNRPDGLFFMGECLEAAGHPADAIEAFERAVEMARQDARHATLQERAEKNASRLRAAY